MYLFTPRAFRLIPKTVATLKLLRQEFLSITESHWRWTQRWFRLFTQTAFLMPMRLIEQASRSREAAETRKIPTLNS